MNDIIQDIQTAINEKDNEALQFLLHHVVEVYSYIIERDKAYGYTNVIKLSVTELSERVQGIHISEPNESYATSITIDQYDPDTNVDLYRQAYENGGTQAGDYDILLELGYYSPEEYTHSFTTFFLKPI